MIAHSAARAALLAGVAFAASAVWADALSRLDPEKLRATRQAIGELARQRAPVATPSGYRDTRCVLHAHSHWSHDSRAPLDEVVAGAKAVGVEAILFTEHPAPHYDFFRDGHRGLHDGVLVIPGAEQGGFLLYPSKSMAGQSPEGPQALADLALQDRGHAFLCHLEERMDWNIAGLTGTEIYNTHADFKDETGLIFAMRSPATMARLGKLAEEYPHEVFGALLDYPADYLRRYDELCQKTRHAGVAGNDSHHNQKYVGRLSADGKQVEVIDFAGDRLLAVELQKAPAAAEMAVGKSPGDELFRIDLDAYPQSFGHTSTHLLLKSFDEAGIWEALEAGRAYVAFDWIGDPTGFLFEAVAGDERFPIGSEIPLGKGLELRVAAPLSGEIRLIRSGKPAAQAQGREAKFTLTEPGVYRVEVWVSLAGEPRPWVLSNPIYVR